MELLNIQFMLPTFALVVARVSGLVVAVPMLATNQIPRLVKALLIASLSFMLLPIVRARIPATVSLSQAVGGLAGELLLGEVLGLSIGLIFFAAQMAGQIVAHQAGFSLGQVFNPLFEEEFTLLDQLWIFVAFMFFLAFRGHLEVVSILLRSFDRVPPLSIVSLEALPDFLTGTLQSMLDVALRLSGPAVLALLLSSVVLGFLTRTMPQMNILSVGFAFKVFIALAAVAFTVSSSSGTVADAFSASIDAVMDLFDASGRTLTRGQ